VHRDALGGRPLELGQASAQEHHPVGVVDVAVLGYGVGAAQPFIGDEDRLGPPQRRDLAGCQYMTSGLKMCHAEAILGCEALIGIVRYPGGSADGAM
jgi:hypothetical protein